MEPQKQTRIERHAYQQQQGSRTIKLQGRGYINNSLNSFAGSYPILIALMNVAGGLAFLLGYINDATGTAGAVGGLWLLLLSIKEKRKTNKILDLDLKNRKNGNLN